MDLFKTISDVGARKFKPNMIAAEAERVGFDPTAHSKYPWAVDKADVKALEKYTDRIIAGNTERSYGAGKYSPFFTDAKSKPACQRDRKMVYWTLLAKSPLSKLYLHMCLDAGASERSVTALFKLMDALAMGTMPTMSRGELGSFEDRMDAACDAIEEAFPKMCSTICMHLLRHLGDQIRRTGPIQCSWTYYVERYVRYVRCIPLIL